MQKSLNEVESYKSETQLLELHNNFKANALTQVEIELIVCDFFLRISFFLSNFLFQFPF